MYSFNIPVNLVGFLKHIPCQKSKFCLKATVHFNGISKAEQWCLPNSDNAVYLLIYLF